MPSRGRWVGDVALLSFEDAYRADVAWLAARIESLTDEVKDQLPSEWAEERRYLPPTVTPLPGPYSFDVAPYLREIVDCLSPDSPIREVAFMKGAQVCGTTGIIENGIGYAIDSIKTAPVMLVTADNDLAKIRLDVNILPMIELSGLSGLIRSSDEKNRRKTGATQKKIEWAGGGFLLPFGAQNANKLRSTSVQILLRDEVDGWPRRVGKDGDPMALSEARTKAYESTRKIVDISTPLIRGQSAIETRFQGGDQRRYFVKCIACSHAQVLRWRRTNDDGEVSGIVWKMDGDHVVPGSVRYLCEKCQHPHSNEDKARLLRDGEWRPTAVPAHPTRRSYHLSALYSPPGMQTWESCVGLWLEAWDEKLDRPLHMGKLQAFYNNVLGESFELRGEKVRFEAVSAHRRSAYRLGEVPNEWARHHASSPILLLTGAVDVHKTELPVAIFGWTKGRRAVLVDYQRLKGDTEQLDDEGTWGALRKLLEERVYVADDGREYRAALTLIDSGYRADTVYQFCSDYDSGVFPCKGRDGIPKASMKPFAPLQSTSGVAGFSVSVDLYKERWHAALRRAWHGQDESPVGSFHVPIDATDRQLKELTVEQKREKIDTATGERLGFEWHRPSGAANELWDLLIYSNAALDILVHDVCRHSLGLDHVSEQAFFEAAETGLFFDSP
jgi:terminase, large subunit